MQKDILLIETLADFEKRINRDNRNYDVNMMVMPGTLQDKHKDVDPEKGIQALRRKFNLIYLLQAGDHDVHLGAEYGWLKPNDLVIVPENFLYASTHIRECVGYCIHFKTEFLGNMQLLPLAESFPFFAWDALHVVSLSGEEAGRIEKCFKNIIAAYSGSSTEREELVRSYLYILLLCIREIYPAKAKMLNEKASRSARISGKFRQLVEKHFLEFREVSQYASMLHISPKHLSGVVKENTGCSPKEIINNMLLLESKVQLGATDKTVTEIAHYLNFLDQAHFSHFIKLHAGCTPGQLQKKNCNSYTISRTFYKFPPLQPGNFEQTNSPRVTVTFKIIIMKQLLLFAGFSSILLLSGTPVKNIFPGFGEKSEVKNFSSPDEVREFPNGKLELIKVGGATIGRATLQPGWTWNSSVQPIAKTKSCEAPHFQYHASGTLMVKMDDGTMLECKAGDVSLLAKGHDAWVVGSEPVVVIDFQGMVDYAKGMK